MKLNPINAVIAMAISILIAYGLFSIESNENRVMVAVGGLMLLSITLITLIGIDFDLTRTGVNIRVVSGVSFLILLVSSLFFSFVGASAVSYLVTNGIVLLVFILSVRSICRARQ